MSIRPRQLARMGTFYLHEAILDVLCDHYLENYGLGAADISRRIGVYREGPPLNDAVVTGYLHELLGQDRVTRRDQDNGQPGWTLTPAEYNRRRDDV